jgi:tetratricopeptide (TPR) repeat protein
MGRMPVWTPTPAAGPVRRRETYDWFVRGRALDPATPAPLPSCCPRRAADPTSRAGWEGLARARFDTGQYAAAAEAFTHLVQVAPDDDYAQFGLGLCAWRLGDLVLASEHLTMAAVMRPDRADYVRALQQVRATRRARGEALGPGPELQT